MKSRPNYGKTLSAPALQRAAMALVLLLAAALLASPRAHAQSVVLDPANPSNWTQVGSQQPIFGSVVLFTDASEADVSGLFAAAPFAAYGTTVDLIASFQVVTQVTAGVDAGFSLIINDGATGRAAVMATILVNGIPHIGLAGQGERGQLNAYPAFIEADWTQPLTVHLRRWADESFEVIALNGAAPSHRVFLAGVQLAPTTRAGATVEFGAYSAWRRSMLRSASFAFSP